MTEFLSLSPELYFDEETLLSRLSGNFLTSNKKISLVLGSSISAPSGPGLPGIPDVTGMIELIRAQFTDTTVLQRFENSLALSENKYQAAFRFLAGNCGPEAPNTIIKQAVWSARKTVYSSNEIPLYLPDANTPDETFRSAERDFETWHLPPAVEAIGKLASQNFPMFGSTILTTNFDPLLEISIMQSGGNYFKSVMHRDGNLYQSTGDGSHIVHLHGYWYGSDTLHSPRQLNQDRPRLKAALGNIIKADTLLVSAYGGWDDIFTSALVEAVLDDASFPDLIWTFYDKEPKVTDAFLKRVSPALDRERILFYSGVNCHTFFPKLLRHWSSDTKPAIKVSKVRLSDSFKSINGINAHLANGTPPSIKPQKNIFDRGEYDRPPAVDVYVGRKNDLFNLENEYYSVGFVTGIGGQGKSALCAKYFVQSEKDKKFDFCIWRDCKEQSERFEHQIVSIIEKLSKSPVSALDLSHLPIKSLTTLFMRVCQDYKLLIVFDNIDHYVDPERESLTGPAHEFVEQVASGDLNSKIIFTCRPTINYQSKSIFSQRLEGLDIDSTVKLFESRGASASVEHITRAHKLTGGHAFWLDLLAAQVAQKANVELVDLLHPLSSSSLEIPTRTLQSIWSTLRQREQSVLRALAETVRPTDEIELAKYLDGRENFQKVVKACKYLRSLNLIVIKPQLHGTDAIELHPLVREFIRRTFPQKERISFIEPIIRVYRVFFGLNQVTNLQKPSFSTIQNWTEAAELCISAGKFDEAFSLLNEISDLYSSSDNPGEFVRVAAILFQSVGWSSHKKFPEFDEVFIDYVKILSHLGRIDEARKMLKNFRETIRVNDARFVEYCSVNCYIEWLAGDFKEAVSWGERGKQLRADAGIESKRDVLHNLALAQRDFGNLDDAIDYFKKGMPLEDVIDVDELNESLGGEFYGNIGRCLHLMGQIDPALICYRKSAILLEKSRRKDNVMNRGYIRHWIGELLFSRGDSCLAQNFFESALNIWNSVAPFKAEKLQKNLVVMSDSFSGCVALGSDQAERFCVAWIYGRDAEFRPAAPENIS